ncbi:MAG: MlaD family protein [Sulfurimonas sp.]|nr:MlaD family protein [Sulfurimonas sp.]
MNNKVNYSIVGFLVLLGLSLMIWFSYWLLKPSNELEMQKYAIYFDESILGLNLDAPVKYKGISVGKISKLSINPKNSQQVEVIVNIFKTTPIKTTTVAKLTSQGITGLSYINLNIGDNNASELKVKDGEKYPVIKTTPSLFIKIEKTFEDVFSDLSSTLSKTNQILGKENQQEISQLFKNSNIILGKENQYEISQLLKNSNIFISKMNKLLDNKIINDFQETINNLNETTKKLNKMIPKVEKFLDNSVEWEDEISDSFKSIAGSYMGIKETMDYFRTALVKGDFNIKDISQEIIPTINSTMIEMQALMIKMQEALDQYERSPGDIIFKQEKIKKGPGEN